MCAGPTSSIGRASAVSCAYEGAGAAGATAASLFSNWAAEEAVAAQVAANRSNAALALDARYFLGVRSARGKALA